MRQSISICGRSTSRILLASGILTLLFFVLSLYGTATGAQLHSGSPSQDPMTLKRVKPVKVCMVNDTVFPKDQIPVKVGDQTYYGCCEMCKVRLRNDKKSRQAIDPVSKKPVDKAKAVIGARPDGKVLYFESEKTFQQYNARASGK